MGCEKYHNLCTPRIAHRRRGGIGPYLQMKRRNLCKMTGSIQSPGGEVYRVFFEALKSDDIDTLIAAASEYFGLPVLLTDEHYKLICQHPRRRIGQEIWDTLYDSRVLPVEIIQDYQQAYLNMDENYYRPFYSGEGPAADCPRIFAEVYANERIYGHVAIFMYDRQPRPEDLAAAQILVDALGMLMVPRRNRESASLSSYLYDLLQEDTAPQARALAVRCLEARITGPFALMVTPIGATASQRAFAEMVISQLPATYRSAVNTIYKRCVVTLFGLMQGESYTPKEVAFFQRVAQYLAPVNPRSGVSRPFTRLAEAGGRFQQAYMTARVTDKPCDFFELLFPLPIFEVVCAGADPEMFLHPALERLKSYDEEHQTEYFNTLRTYSLTLHDKDATAAALCIHRNTLLYRLNRISDLFAIPYEEPRTALALLNSFQLYGVSRREPDRFWP